MNKRVKAIKSTMSHSRIQITSALINKQSDVDQCEEFEIPVLAVNIAHELFSNLPGVSHQPSPHHNQAKDHDTVMTESLNEN